MYEPAKYSCARNTKLCPACLPDTWAKRIYEPAKQTFSAFHSRFLLHGQRLVAARARGPKRHGGTWRVQVARSLRKAQDSTPARVHGTLARQAQVWGAWLANKQKGYLWNLNQAEVERTNGSAQQKFLGCRSFCSLSKCDGARNLKG